MTIPIKDTRPVVISENDIFYSLYYGQRFDVLRRLCHRTKREMEKRLNNPSITIHCHLVAPEITQIVASSL